MASVRVRFLGSGDAFGSGGRFQTCILIETNGYKCLLDCGASSLIALKGASVKPNDIDTILVTHLHGDHFGGIPFFILDGQFSRRTKPVLVAGPPGTRTRVREAMEVLFAGSSTARRRFEVEIEELVEDVPWAHGPMTVTPFEVVHACGAPPYALRVDLGGKIITYSGDTQWTDRLVDAAAGADLFICEAYFYDKRVPFHLDYETLMQNRAKIDCQRIVVTHSAADLVARLPELELEAAYDGLEIAL